jgi:simple sugar transport system ATP-binding protein
VDGLSFSVRAGEILGLAGVDGNGQAELEETLTGVRAAHGGSVVLDGANCLGSSPRALIRRGISCIPSDRLHRGMVGEYTVGENLVLPVYNRPPFARGPLLQLGAIARAAQEIVSRFDVRTPGVTTKARFLSGGNQQKMVVGRELSRPTRLLIAAQPTRGVDVGAIEFIHRNIVRERDAGVAVLLISASLDEILALSDTIGVLYRGRLMGVLRRTEANVELLGLMMAGTPLEEARAEAAALPEPETRTTMVTGG